jgi:L-2-hydroxyglutarate oxidase LhgO
MAALEQLYQRGVANGVEDLHWLSVEEAQAAQPGLQCLGALASPSTGIIDSHGLMLSLLGDLEEAGGMLALGAPLLSVDVNDAGFELEVGGEEPMRLQAEELINCAGLYSVDVAQSIQGLAAAHIPETVLAKGSYFRLQGKSPFTQLIYPAPVTGGLGVHLTIDLGGQVRFGPDVEFLGSNAPDDIDYTVNPERAASFYAQVRRYWPALPDNSLLPDYSGVRPKVAYNGTIHSDFYISTAQQHGIKGLVNLFGIESPGLTASLALAKRVTQLLGRA